MRNPLFEYRQRQSYADIDKTPGPQTDNYPADCTVEDCLLRHFGVVEKQATGVQISMSMGITIRHCSIYEASRAGINISEGTFGGHLIEFCDVFDTVRETGDHGSFNSWGRDRFWRLEDAPADELPQLALLDAAKPTVLRNNRWRCDHGWDVDLDDGSTNYEIYNNLFLHGGLKLREGFHRRVWNNIAVGNSLHPHVWYDNSGDEVTEEHLHGRLPPCRRHAQGQVGKEDRRQPLHHLGCRPDQVRRSRLRCPFAGRRPVVRRSGQRGLSRQGRLARAGTWVREFPDGPVRRAEARIEEDRPHAGTAWIRPDDSDPSTDAPAKAVAQLLAGSSGEGPRGRGVFGVRCQQGSGRCPPERCAGRFGGPAGMDSRRTT